MEGVQRSFTVAELITIPQLDEAAGVLTRSLHQKLDDCLAELYLISRFQPDAAGILMNGAA